jgi:hypothetical protein
MAGVPSARVATVVARTVDRFVAKFDFAALDEDRRIAAFGEIVALRSSLGQNSPLIDSAFARLERALRQRGKSQVRHNPLAARKLARMLRALTPLAMVAAGVSVVVASPAMAALPTYSVGEAIINPSTGTSETVSQSIGNYGVLTSAGHFILLAQTVGDTYTVTDNSTSPATVTTYQVTAVTLTSGRVTQVTIKDLGANTSSTIATTKDYAGAPDIGGGTGTGINYASPTTPGTRYLDIQSGGEGGDGRDGGGVCFGALGCIEYSPGDGGDGGTGPTINDTIATSWGWINTTSAKQAAIAVVS